MRRSRIKPKKITFVQKQKNHPKPKPLFNVCVNCGCSTDKFIESNPLMDLINGCQRPALERAMIERYGLRHPNTLVPLRVVYICGLTCIKTFIDNHKLELLEEITK
jgi:hypothetical protein